MLISDGNSGFAASLVCRLAQHGDERLTKIESAPSAFRVNGRLASSHVLSISSMPLLEKDARLFAGKGERSANGVGHEDTQTARELGAHSLDGPRSTQHTRREQAAAGLSEGLQQLVYGFFVHSCVRNEMARELRTLCDCVIHSREPAGVCLDFVPCLPSRGMPARHEDQGYRAQPFIVQLDIQSRSGLKHSNT